MMTVVSLQYWPSFVRVGEKALPAAWATSGAPANGMYAWTKGRSADALSRKQPVSAVRLPGAAPLNFYAAAQESSVRILGPVPVRTRQLQRTPTAQAVDHRSRPHLADGCTD
jgi:hypothetical protein